MDPRRHLRQSRVRTCRATETSHGRSDSIEQLNSEKNAEGEKSGEGNYKHHPSAVGFFVYVFVLCFCFVFLFV